MLLALFLCLAVLEGTITLIWNYQHRVYWIRRSFFLFFLNDLCVLSNVDHEIRGLRGLNGRETAYVNGSFRRNTVQRTEKDEITCAGGLEASVLCWKRSCVLVTYLLSGAATSHAYFNNHEDYKVTVVRRNRHTAAESTKQ
jgi:hypothetical protein